MPNTPNGVTPASTKDGRSGFLSDVIVELGFAERESVDWAVKAARRPGTTVAAILLETGEITEDQLARAVAERYGLCHVDLEEFEIDPDAANLVTREKARRNRAVPVGFVEDKLLVAISDPTDSPAVQEIAAGTEREVRPAVASAPALDALIESLPLASRPKPVEAAPPSPAAPPAEAAPVVEPQPPAAAHLPSPPRPLDGSRLRDELSALRTQLAGAEAKLGGQPRSEGGTEVEQLRAELATAVEELTLARARLREAKEVSAELEVVRERLATAEAELDRPQDDDWLRRRLGLLQAERDDALRRAHKAELELQELRDRGRSGRWTREDSELPDLH